MRRLGFLAALALALAVTLFVASTPVETAPANAAAPDFSARTVPAQHAVKSAKPGKPSAKTPKGTITTSKPTFAWSKVAGAAKYELRVYRGGTLLIKKTGIAKRSWKSTKALPENVGLTWKVRARNARGAGAWSKSLAFKIVPGGLEIGDPYQGGKVAYILQPGDPGYDAEKTHGLVVTVADKTPQPWSNIQTTPVEDTSTAMGTGYANTLAIAAQYGCAEGAANLCRHLQEGGCVDWYLPSRDELNAVRGNRFILGGFEAALYWSSSEWDANHAWVQLLNDGAQMWISKENIIGVRPVRSF